MKNTDTTAEFCSGYITCVVKTNVAPAQLASMLAKNWQDGYVAFANGEKRLSDLSQIPLASAFLTERINGKLDGIEGYVTEINLWRCHGSVIEEIAVEREENTYLVQHFCLDTAPELEGNCQYRHAVTRAGAHHSRTGSQLFSGPLESVEVIWPENRLNIFLTKGAQ